MVKTSRIGAHCIDDKFGSRSHANDEVPAITYKRFAHYGALVCELSIHHVDLLDHISFLGVKFADPLDKTRL